jgi:SPX domain protein involved in polyphosphate accumulation
MPGQPLATTESIQIARSEFKYQVSGEELAAIQKWLLRYCVPDENSQGGEWYPIRSLYLDNSDFRLYQDAAEKLPFRLKLRARAYGDARGSVKLEVKRRVRDLIVKTSATAKQAQWASAARGLQGLCDTATPAMGEFLQLTETLQATPRVLVYYERQAFSSAVDDYVRVTFDRHMACQPMRAWDLHGDPREWLAVDAPKAFGERDSPYVLEIKFVDRPPAWLRDLTLRFGLERRGFSKYGRAVQRGVLHFEPAWDVSPGARFWLRSVA